MFALVKEKVSLDKAVEFLGLEMKKSNNQLRGKCPACKSDNPRALAVTPGEGFYCWSQKRGGDVIALVAHVRGISQREAAQLLAAHYRLVETPVPPLPGPSPIPPPARPCYLDELT